MEPAEGGQGAAPKAGSRPTGPGPVRQSGMGVQPQGQALIWDWKLGDPRVSIYVQAAHKQPRAAVRRVCSVLVVHVYYRCPR